MFEEEFEKLNSSEQALFRIIVNDFLSHTYLQEEEFDFSVKTRRINKSYAFVQRHLDLFRKYFEFGGFSLEDDSNYGVIALHSSTDANRIHLDKMTTVMIYTIRLIYEEEREKLSLNGDIMISVADLVNKMMILNVVDKRPAINVLSASLRTIAHFRIIQKESGQWQDMETRFLIQPVILFAVSNEQISTMDQMLKEKGDEELDEDEDAEEAAADSLVQL